MKPWCFGSFACVLILSCGHKNYVASRAPASLQEQAELDMEAGSRAPARYADAQRKLEALLENEPQNQSARSLLAASYAAQGGVVLLSLITKVATAGATGGVTPELLWETFPAPTADKLDLMKEAVETMGNIPVAELTSEMTFQKGVFLAAYGIFALKKLREDLLALGAVSAESADLALDVLRQAAEVAGGSGSPIGGAIGSVVTAVESQPGENTSEKMKGWLETQVP